MASVSVCGTARPGKDRVERPAQVVLGDLLPRLAQGRVEVVDAAPIADGSGTVDDNGLGRDRCVRLLRDDPQAIDGSRNPGV